MAGRRPAHVVQQLGNVGGFFIQRMVACPDTYSAEDPVPDGFKRYYGNSCIFHCCFDGIIEDIVPSVDDPQNECFYDETGVLVDSSHPQSGCGGTPNYHDSESDPLGHTFNDPGGIWHAGWDAFTSSMGYLLGGGGQQSEDNRRYRYFPDGTLLDTETGRVTVIKAMP